MKNWIVRCFAWLVCHRTSLLHAIQTAAIVWVAYELHDLNDTIYGAGSGVVDKVDDVARKIDEVTPEVARLADEFSRLADHQLFK